MPCKYHNSHWLIVFVLVFPPQKRRFFHVVSPFLGSYFNLLLSTDIIYTHQTRQPKIHFCYIPILYSIPIQKNPL